MSTFTVLACEYCVLVFLSGIGILQASAAYAGLRGLLIAPGEVRVRLFPSTRIFVVSREDFGRIFAVVLIAPALLDFFYWNWRNKTGIIEGAQQAGFFVLAMASAVAFTFLFSSLINHWRLRRNETQAMGLEALRDITWAQAITRRLARMNRGLG